MKFNLLYILIYIILYLDYNSYSNYHADILLKTVNINDFFFICIASTHDLIIYSK
jgi:hypothetical protein